MAEGEVAAAVGFHGLPKRWVVERTFSWIDQNRQMSKDYERLAQTSEALVYEMERLDGEAVKPGREAFFRRF